MTEPGWQIGWLVEEQSRSPDLLLLCCCCMGGGMWLAQSAPRLALHSSPPHPITYLLPCSPEA